MTCRCGHPREMHKHAHHRGTYCGRPDGCNRFRRDWRGAVRRLLL